MAKHVKVGNKTPKKMDRQTGSAQLPPLPKMYQMGISKGVEQERERIIKLLKNNIGWIEAVEYDYWADELADLITGRIAGRLGDEE